MRYSQSLALCVATVAMAAKLVCSFQFVRAKQECDEFRSLHPGPTYKSHPRILPTRTRHPARPNRRHDVSVKTGPDSPTRKPIQGFFDESHGGNAIAATHQRGPIGSLLL
jgi:hypothetical protein